jgi:DNA-binding NarL/FixJ family response regulator
MKKREDSASIDAAIEEIDSTGPVNAATQLEQYKQLLIKAKKLSYKKGIAVINKMIAAILLRWRKHNEAEPYVEEGLEITGRLKERGELYFNLRLQQSQVVAFKGRHDETIAIATGLLNNYGDKMSSETFIRCHLSAGNGYWMQNMLYNAMYTLQKVLLHREKLSQVTGYNMVWMTYANVLKDLNLHEKARDEMNEILKQAKLSPFDAIVMNINLSTLYAGAFNDYENGRKYMDECSSLLQQHSFPELEYGASVNWACNLVAMGRYAEALPLIMDKEKMQPERQAARDTAEWKYMVGRCLLETGSVDDALPWIRENETLVLESGLQRQKILCYDNYFLYHSLKGNAAEARKYHSLYKEAQEEDNRMTHDLQAKQIDALINLERKEHELQVEKLRHEQVEQDAEHARQQNAMMQMNIEQRNKLIDEFQSAIKRLELSDARRKEIFKGLHEKIITVKRSSTELAEYDAKFNSGHREKVEKLQHRFPSITSSEAKIAIMLASGLSNKEIAGITLTTTRNVETQRFSLRKKMKLKAGQDLVKKIQEASV